MIIKIGKFDFEYEFSTWNFSARQENNNTF